jgi:LAO/AO transport system kinase
MTSALPEPAALAAAVGGRDRLALAKALNLLDDRRPAARQCAAAFLDALPADKLDCGGHLIGITGPPGAGKSSLTAALIQVWRRRGLKVAILAVDPSSPISGGALLGDRLRMHASGADREVFIRSLACRGEFGGLSAEVWPMSLAMLAAFDIVLVETVGVGQKEIDVSKMTDTTCFVAQPASGDSIQFLKAGIMEVPHVIVVNKEDIGMAARKTLSELRNTLRRQVDPDAWQVPALSASAALGSGIEQLADALDGHRLVAGARTVHRPPPALSGGMAGQTPAGGIRPLRHRPAGWRGRIVRGHWPPRRVARPSPNTKPCAFA